VNKAALTAVLSLTVLSSAGMSSSVARDAADAGTTNWTAHNADADERAYSVLDRINTGNVQRLGLAWSLELEGEASLEATPLAIDGVLYFTGSYATVYAVDALTGRVLWKFDPQTWKHAPGKMLFSFAANRGAAYADGRIFSATLDGRLVALDAKTGSLLWSAQTVPESGGKTITGPPRAFNGKVIIGNGGADFGERGFVTAYDAATGRQLWRFYVAPGKPEENAGDPAMERAAATWNGPYWQTGTGGAVWDSITFDHELNRIYLGTGNAGPYDASERSPGGGDNLYTASIVALDADTGKYVWHYQTTPRDTWDYDATQQMTLADLVIGGKPRKVLMQAPKNGFFYVLDRRTGQLISAEKLGKVTWAERIDLASGRPVEAKDARYDSGDAIVWPGSMGAHSFQSMSFSPKTGLVYVPYMQLATHFHKGKPSPGVFALGDLSIGGYQADAADDKGALIAWNPVQQKARWKVPLQTIWNGGALATAGNLVFQGTGDGYLHAYDASSGKELWRFNAGLGIIAPPMSYSVNGHQYVSVLVGYGGSAAVWGKLMQAGWKYGAQPRRLLTFSLDAKGTLPSAAPADWSVKALDDASLQFSESDVEQGHALYNLVCSACHGLNLLSAGSPGPDLRESRLALTEEGVWAAVHDGALISRGMPQISMFGRPQVDQIYAYIRTGAREAVAHGSQTSNDSGAAHH
jgi:quinohemoprotein ethanol dehydrogenase